MLENFLEWVGKSRSRSIVFALTIGFLYFVLSMATLHLLLCLCGTKLDSKQTCLWLFALAEVLFLLAAIRLSLCSFNEIALKGQESLSDLLEILAAKPKKSSYNWQGGISIVNSVLSWLICLLRRASVLQFSKFIYRETYKDPTEPDIKHINIPPVLQESYIAVWAVFLIIQISMGLNCSFVYGLNAYFLIESTTWILYYGVFRRFFEKEYETYHELEHLHLILFMIPLQAIAYAACLMNTNASTNNTTWCKVMPVLLGQADEDMIIPGIFGFLYSAIVISMVIRSFPDEKVKPGNPSTMIIGAGNVVRNLLMPALMQRMENIGQNKKIRIYSKETIENIPEQWNLSGKTEIKNIFSLIVETKEEDFKNAVAWIETPSDTHLYYLELLKKQVGFIAMEKPIVSNMNDLILLKDFISSENRKKVFFLSYYILEKALPLTFLARPRDFYLKYFKDTEILEKYYQMFLTAGHLKSIIIELVEDKDERHLPAGGQLIETFIHHCLIASLFAGLPDTWEINEFENSDPNNTARSKIHLHALGAQGEEITLDLIKGFDEKHHKKTQRAELVFDNAVIKANFIAKTAEITSTSTGESVKVGLADEYLGRYAVQCDMVYRVYADHTDPSDIDGLYHQIEVLEWMLSGRLEKTEKKWKIKRGTKITYYQLFYGVNDEKTSFYSVHVCGHCIFCQLRRQQLIVRRRFSIRLRKAGRQMLPEQNL